MNPSICAERLGVSIDDRPIFAHLSLSCPPSSITALVGVSGSGKTTVLNCLGLLQRPTEGTIRIGEHTVTEWKDRQRLRFWRDSAAFIYQDYGIIPDQSVAYNVVLRANGLMQRHTAVDEHLSTALSEVGLRDRAQDPARVLSGGEKQRVGIARAIYKKAAYIFADEPTASLDAKNRDAVWSLLRNAATNGACVIVATHDNSVEKHADQVISLTTPAP